MSKRETSSDIDDAAASWAMRLDDADLDAAARQQFDAWLEGDVRRVGAFARAQAVLVHAKRAKALGPDFEPSAFEPAAFEPEPGVDDDVPAPAFLSRRKWLIGASAVAASGAIAFLVPLRRASAHVYETALGETRLVPLADGSAVTLNTNSRISVTMADGRRAVALDRGEALFKVASEPGTPFLVEAGEVALHTSGATFSVCRLAARPLEVKVCDGAVALRTSMTNRLLRANTEATLARDGRLSARAVDPQVLARALAWQEGMLSFEDTPLAQAAEQFGRYSDRRILVTDPAVATETVTGLYAASNPEGFARAVALGLNLHVQSTPAGLLITR